MLKYPPFVPLFIQEGCLDKRALRVDIKCQNREIVSTLLRAQTGSQGKTILIQQTALS